MGNDYDNEWVDHNLAVIVFAYTCMKKFLARSIRKRTDLESTLVSSLPYSKVTPIMNCPL